MTPSRASLGNQWLPRCRSGSVIDVKDHCNVGVTQLDELLMNRIAPKQDFCPFDENS